MDGWVGGGVANSTANSRVRNGTVCQKADDQQQPRLNVRIAGGTTEPNSVYREFCRQSQQVNTTIRCDNFNFRRMRETKKGFFGEQPVKKSVLYDEVDRRTDTDTLVGRPGPANGRAAMSTMGGRSHWSRFL